MSTAAAKQDPFAEGHARFLERVSHIVPPKPIRIFPGPSDMEAVAQYLRDMVEVFNDTIEAIGFQVADNSPYRVDCTDFSVDAGAAVDACTHIAERLREERGAA